MRKGLLLAEDTPPPTHLKSPVSLCLGGQPWPLYHLPPPPTSLPPGQETAGAGQAQRGVLGAIPVGLSRVAKPSYLEDGHGVQLPAFLCAAPNPLSLEPSCCGGRDRNYPHFTGGQMEAQAMK